MLTLCSRLFVAVAEFAVTGGFLWYDISIIPTGAVGVSAWID